MKKIKKTILTVCNDAGGAEVVSSFVRKNRNKYRFFCVVRGPAVLIFQRKSLRNVMMEFGEADNPALIFEKTGGVALLLTGTSWSTDLELKFINEAKQRNIKTAAYLDHWVNYRERFGYPAPGWKKKLPNEIWVGDKYALAAAKKTFPVAVKFTPNEFFNDIKKEWRGYKNVKPNETVILFVSEPMDAMRNKGRSAEEGVILEEVMNLLIKTFPGARLLIRLHPSEPPEKHQELVVKYGQNLKIEVHSSKENMLADLAQVAAVIGMKSMFLVVAALCGKKTSSFLPGGNQNCPLPEKKIVKIKDINKLKSWLIDSIITK